MMRCFRPPFWRALAHDHRGVSVVEFALVAPFLGLLVMGISDLSRGLSAKFALDQAAHRTLERSLAGARGSPAATQDYDYLKTEAAAAAGVPESAVTLTKWLECAGTRMDSFQGTCAPGEEIARYVQLTINSRFTPTFPYGPMGRAATDGTVPVVAEAALRVQ